MMRPGRWLRAAAACVWAKPTLDRVVDPVIADLLERSMPADSRWRPGRSGRPFTFGLPCRPRLSC